MVLHQIVILLIGLTMSVFLPHLYAADSVSGTLTVDGKATALKNVYIHFKEDPFDKAKQNLVVTMTDVALSAEAMDSPFELSDMAVAGKLHLAEFTLDEEKRIVGTKILHNSWKEGGITMSGSGSESMPVNISGSSADGKIERNGDTFGHKWAVNAQFKATVPAKAAKQQPSGSPLPAGGGEPGKAYMEYLKAMQAGDIAGLKKTVISTRAKELDRPEVKEMLGFMKEMMAKDIKITGGTSDGTNAWLQATGKDPGGQTANGNIEMKMEEGRWKLVKDAWNVKM